MSTNEAGAGPNKDLSSNAATSTGELLNQLGDAAVFKHFQRSGNLDFMNIDAAGNEMSNGNYVVYPEDLHTNPEYGQLVHFDIYFKQNPKMEDVTSKISNAFDSAVGGISDLYSGGVDSIKEAGANLSEGGLLDAPGNIMDMAGDLATQAGVKILNFIGDNSQLPEFANEQIIKDTRLGKADQESKDKITLYLPAGLQNSDTLNYEEHDLGFIKGMLDGNLSSLIPGAVSKVAGFADGVVNVVGGELNSANAIQALTGAVRNPRKEQMFSGVEYRTFDFNFTFRPKSKKEALDMLTICKLFRFHAHPEINQSMAYYLMPSEFQITFIDIKNGSGLDRTTDSSGDFAGYASENGWINKIGRCALTSVSVNYHPNDVSTTFENGIPTAVDLTLSFTEMEPISRNHVYAGF